MTDKKDWKKIRKTRCFIINCWICLLQSVYRNLQIVMIVNETLIRLPWLYGICSWVVDNSDTTIDSRRVGYLDGRGGGLALLTITGPTLRPGIRRVCAIDDAMHIQIWKTTSCIWTVCYLHSQHTATLPGLYINAMTMMMLMIPFSTRHLVNQLVVLYSLAHHSTLCNDYRYWTERASTL